MTGVVKITITEHDAEQRLDRWFKKKFPTLGHGQLEKLLRTGQIRLDGKRASANNRLAAGQEMRIPPLPQSNKDALPPAPQKPKKWDDRKIADLQARVLYKDDDLIALDKPSGLPVQGGSGVAVSLDDLLDHLRFGGERPKLVHRLDRDTSGILILARHDRAARSLAEMFREKETRKIYWALVVSTPHPLQGRVDMGLSKGGARGAERVNPDQDGKRAVTYYSVLEHAGKKAAFLALMPVTGRTHQLRAHCAALGHPIIGDGKYGGAKAHLGRGEISSRLHLHARSLRLPKLSGKGLLTIEAPLPDDLKRSWRFFGFSENQPRDPFINLE